MMSTDSSRSEKKIIEAFDVRKSFGNLEVLKGVSMEVTEGKTMVIVGPSGSGKSTLIRCFNHWKPSIQVKSSLRVDQYRAQTKTRGKPDLRSAWFSRISNCLVI